MNFPHKMIKTINGPFEGLAYAVGVLAGCYLGWEAGSSMVEYANKINPETIGAVDAYIKANPLVTKLVTLSVGGELIGEISRFPGFLTDMIIGTYQRD